MKHLQKKGAGIAKRTAALALALSLGTIVPVMAEDAAAIPTASTVLVNGNPMAFDACTIGGHNYFKLRDIAAVTNGSPKQFEVSWDNHNKAVHLFTNQPYTCVGGEMRHCAGRAGRAALCTSALYKDGEPIHLQAYTMDGNTYFKLRDLGQTLDFGVTWDAANNSVLIDTDSANTMEPSAEPTLSGNAENKKTTVSGMEYYKYEGGHHADPTGRHRKFHGGHAYVVNGSV